VQLDNKKSIASAQSDVVNKKISYDNAIAQNNLKLAKPREVDIASLRTQVSQALSNYEQAQTNLDEAKIKSPIDGIIANVSQKVGEQAEPSVAAMTVITKKKIATITLNEVDIAKVKTGQRATITFSAIDGLSITGEVAEMDIIGTVSQGVVSYSVKIALDTDDDQIKPQMSVAATIINQDKADAILVPSSAIKSDNSGNSYVEVLGAIDAKNISENNLTITTTNAVDTKYITIGLYNDDNTEITEGLNVGDYVITKISKLSASSASKSTQTSGLNLLGGGGMGGARR
jgi:RND family efflux transporter MFP subunit